MKTKNLLAVIATMTVAFSALAADGYGRDNDNRFGYGNQQVVVNNYYFDNGYEYASRIKRFHNSYVAFDFYSPVFTETFWYNYTPYTWGVSIYDDWYYYGAGISRYSWRSGFGGSYWWGYDPYWDYDPWMGYGWNSWYNPGISFNINLYLGRPHYHYPVAWNRWSSYNHRDNYRPAYFVNNNNHYNSNHRDGYNNNRDYNPSHPYDVTRRNGYTITNGRSTGSNYTSPAADAGRNQGTNIRSDQGTRTNSGNTNSRGNNANQGGNDKDKSNNGLRVGQYRRGVAEPTGPKPNEPNRPNNPNLNDRTDPGKEKAGTTTRTNSDVNRNNTGAQTRQQGQGNVSGRTTQTQPRQQTQSTVRTNTRTKEPSVKQNTSGRTSQPKQTTVQKSTRSSSKESTGNGSSNSESKRRSSSSQGKR